MNDSTLQNPSTNVKPILTQERLKELLSYDPETGVFVWLISTGNRALKGSIVGTDHGNGYRKITIDQQTYYSHRLAWFYTHGKWPEYEIDHRDLNRSNNRLLNIRRATPIQNRQNLRIRSNNKSGKIGVSWAKNCKKWEAYIWKNYKKIGLGYFDDLEEAGKAYLTAKRELHTFQPVPIGAE